MEFAQICHSAEIERRTDFQSACLQFKEAVNKFKPSMEALERLFNQAEKVWSEEHGKQERIISASDIASR